MTGEVYKPGNPNLDKDNLLSPVIPPLIPAVGMEHSEPERIADTIARVNKHAKLAQAKYRGMRVGSFGIVLEPTTLYEIIESAKISPLPGVTSVCKGLINHRSNVVPIYDITELTGIKPQVWERKRLLVLDTRESAVGVLLYDLPVEIGIDDPVEDGEITDVPEIFHRHAMSCYRNGGRLWLSLNRNSFFAELNMLCIRAA